MKKKYTRKLIVEAIQYWSRRLRMMNEDVETVSTSGLNLVFIEVDTTITEDMVKVFDASRQINTFVNLANRDEKHLGGELYISYAFIVDDKTKDLLLGTEYFADNFQNSAATIVGILGDSTPIASFSQGVTRVTPPTILLNGLHAKFILSAMSKAGVLTAYRFVANEASLNSRKMFILSGTNTVVLMLGMTTFYKNGSVAMIYPENVDPDEHPEEVKHAGEDFYEVHPYSLWGYWQTIDSNLNTSNLTTSTAAKHKVDFSRLVKLDVDNAKTNEFIDFMQKRIPFLSATRQRQLALSKRRHMPAHRMAYKTTFRR